MSDQIMSIKIDLDTLPKYKCVECQGEQFVPVFSIKAVSSLTSPAGKAGALHHQIGFMCTNCGAAKLTADIANDCKAIVEGSGEESNTPANLITMLPGGKA